MCVPIWTHRNIETSYRTHQKIYLPPSFPIHNKFYIYFKVEEYEKRVVVQKLSHKHALCTQKMFFFSSFISQRLYEVDFLCVPPYKKRHKNIFYNRTVYTVNMQPTSTQYNIYCENGWWNVTKKKKICDPMV